MTQVILQQASSGHLSTESDSQTRTRTPQACGTPSRANTSRWLSA